MKSTTSRTGRAAKRDHATSPATIDPATWKGRTAVDASGRKVGEIAEVYPSVGSAAVHWLAISTGSSGTLITFALASGARAAGAVVRLAA